MYRVLHSLTIPHVTTPTTLCIFGSFLFMHGLLSFQPVLDAGTRPMLLTLFLRSGHSVTMTLLDNPRVIQEKHVVVNNRCTGNQPSLCYTCIPAVQGRVACNKPQLQCSAQYSFCISDYKLNEIFCGRQKLHY